MSPNLFPKMLPTMQSQLISIMKKMQNLTCISCHLDAGHYTQIILEK